MLKEIVKTKAMWDKLKPQLLEEIKELDCIYSLTEQERMLLQYICNMFPNPENVEIKCEQDHNVYYILIQEINNRCINDTCSLPNHDPSERFKSIIPGQIYKLKDLMGESLC